MPHSYRKLGKEVGKLVEAKAAAYGDSATKSERIMAELYPNGVPVHALKNALLIVRMVDKLCRLSNQGADGKDRGGEDPWRDLAGYALIGLKRCGQ